MVEVHAVEHCLHERDLRRAEKEQKALQSLLLKIEDEISLELSTLITKDEIEALKERITNLISEGVFPHPNPEWPHIPWPPF